MPKTILITGANRGIGLALAREAATRGYAVIAGCRTPEQATELNEVEGARIAPLDVTDPESIRAFATFALDGERAIDLLVNNAGVNATASGGDAKHSGVLELAPEHFEAQMRVNAIGPMLVTRALLPGLERAAQGLIVNISSQLGALALGSRMRRDIGYNASKAALNMVTVALAGELEAEGIRAIAVHPGWVQTDMGGGEAPLSAEASAAAMLDSWEQLPSGTTGAFLTWEGRPHPW